MCIAKEQFGKLDHLCKCDQILDSFWRNVMVTRCTSQDNAFQMNCELSFLWAFLRWGESVFVTNIIYFNYLSHKNHILVLTKVLLGYSKPNFIDIYVLNQSNYHWIRWKVLWCFQLFWLLTQWTWNPHHFMNVSWREEKHIKMHIIQLKTQTCDVITITLDHYP